MSTATEITRLQTARNTIRNKMVELGLGTSTDLLDDLATEVDSIQNRGAVSATVQEGQSYTIPAGYHSGAGTVRGVAGGGNYQLQAKTATPTKSQQSVTADSGYYGLSGVTIAAIPEAYQDVTSVTAAAGDVLSPKIIVDSHGTVTAGTMPNNGAIARTLDTTTTSTTIPAGYHNGSGTVSITTETKSATPTKETQTVVPTAGKVLSSVAVAPIPDNYIDTSDATATPSQILTGVSAYVDGELIDGEMPLIANDGGTLDTQTTSCAIAEGYHDGLGLVDVATDSTYESDAVVPTTSQQLIQGENNAFLTAVLVDAIPSEYQDVSGVTATAGDVLDGASFVDANGDTITGAMANNGSVTTTIDGLTSTSVTIPAGYTTGGTVSLTNDIEQALAAI